MDEYKDLMRGTKSEGLEPSFLILDNGYYTIISGSGKIFNAFCKNKSLGNLYTGRYAVPRDPSDPKYSQSRLRILPFDKAFTFLPNDVDSREYYIFIVRPFTAEIYSFPH